VERLINPSGKRESGVGGNGAIQQPHRLESPGTFEEKTEKKATWQKETADTDTICKVL